jgi:hypothetical protein
MFDLIFIMNENNDKQLLERLVDRDDNEPQNEKTPLIKRIENLKKFYNKLTEGSISGSVYCLLCITFGSGINIDNINFD